MDVALLLFGSVLVPSCAVDVDDGGGGGGVTASARVTGRLLLLLLVLFENQRPVLCMVVVVLGCIVEEVEQLPEGTERSLRNTDGAVVEAERALIDSATGREARPMRDCWLAANVRLTWRRIILLR